MRTFTAIVSIPLAVLYGYWAIRFAGHGLGLNEMPQVGMLWHFLAFTNSALFCLDRALRVAEEKFA